MSDTSEWPEGVLRTTKAIMNALVERELPGHKFMLGDDRAMMLYRGELIAAVGYRLPDYDGDHVSSMRRVAKLVDELIESVKRDEAHRVTYELSFEVLASRFEDGEFQRSTGGVKVAVLVEADSLERAVQKLEYSLHALCRNQKAKVYVPRPGDPARWTSA